MNNYKWVFDKSFELTQKYWKKVNKGRKKYIKQSKSS